MCIVPNRLTQPTTGNFQPIGELTTKIDLTKLHTVHYQVTISSSSTDFWSKLQVNYFNAGSLVHSGNQQFKTATGFWMGNLNPGYYTFEVHYKSSSSISMSASWDYQTAVINVIEGLVINYNPHPGIIYPWCDTCIQFELQ